jgi:hypothetical protein
VIEITTFRLTEGTDVEAFLAADAAAQTGFFYAQPGIVRRTTARGDDGAWVEVTLWGSVEDADAAAERATDDPTAAALLALRDPRSVERRRYTELEG